MGRASPSDIENKLKQRTGSGNAVHPLGSGSSAHQVYEGYRPFKRWFPWLVPSFVVANIAVFVVTMSINNCPKYSSSCVASSLGRFSFQPFKENPLLGPSSSTLLKMGALDVNKVVHEHQGWRLITCIWLHAGVFHVLANMLSLLFIGIRLEQEFGFVRIGMIYIISGVGGSLLSALFIQSSISVGASGALFGLLGGMLSELITNWTIYANKTAALLTLLVIIIVNLAVGVLPHVDNFAHIGGFISGFLLGFVFLIRPQFGWVSQKLAQTRHGAGQPKTKPKHKMYQYVLWILSMILLIVGFTVGFVMLTRGVNGNDHCSWCHYLSCAPINNRSCKATSVDCMVRSTTHCVFAYQVVFMYMGGYDLAESNRKSFPDDGIRLMQAIHVYDLINIQHESTQTGNSLNLTCVGSGKYHVYQLSNPSDNEIKERCLQLCT